MVAGVKKKDGGRYSGSRGPLAARVRGPVAGRGRRLGTGTEGRWLGGRGLVGEYPTRGAVGRWQERMGWERAREEIETRSGRRVVGTQFGLSPLTSVNPPPQPTEVMLTSVGWLWMTEIA
jgi:hypothetical protein